MAASRERGTGRLFDDVSHVPDGLLLPADRRRVAIEVECAAKGSARCRAVLVWYASTMAFDQVRWFVDDAHLRGRLAALDRMDLVVQQPLPAIHGPAPHLGGRPGRWLLR